MPAPRSITNKRSINSIVSKYQKGVSLATIADHYDVAITTIRNYLIREGVELRPRGRRRKA